MHSIIQNLEVNIYVI